MSDRAAMMSDTDDTKPGRLVLGRRPGESILIYPADGGPPIMVELVAARKGYGRLGIIAPKDWRIERVGVARQERV